VIEITAQAFPTPALRQEREGRGTHFVADANEIKSLGHPPTMPCDPFDPFCPERPTL
jgi:hypothetical protein